MTNQQTDVKGSIIFAAIMFILAIAANVFFLMHIQTDAIVVGADVVGGLAMLYFSVGGYEYAKSNGGVQVGQIAGTVAGFLVMLITLWIKYSPQVS